MAERIYIVHGPQPLHAAEIDVSADHRLAFDQQDAFAQLRGLDGGALPTPSPSAIPASTVSRKSAVVR